MRPLRALAFAAVALAACAPATGPTDGGPATSGTLALLTYNVAGLPQGLNDDQFPERNIPLISPKLNAYDLVVVQEDFEYTQALRADITLPYESYPLEGFTGLIGDGLNQFSRFPFDPDLTRVQWEACFGTTDNSSDCLATKGFSVSVVELPAPLVVVNLHGEAGGGPDDVAARNTGFAQLAAYLSEHHTGDALLVAGDTNLGGGEADDEPTLQALLDDVSLIDACRALACGEEHIDRVMLRSSDALTLDATAWAVAEEMVDDDSLPLSDHEAIHVDVAWSIASD